MRVTTAFNRLLRLPGARVIDVSFSAEGVIVEVALRRRHPVCSAGWGEERRLDELAGREGIVQSRPRLAARERYVAASREGQTVDRVVRDLAGNPMARARSWSFTARR